MYVVIVIVVQNIVVFIEQASIVSRILNVIYLFKKIIQNAILMS